MIVPAVTSLEEFLAWEELQEQKFEFANGEISLFPGGTNRHGTIGVNLTVALRTGGCSAGTVYYETKAVTARSSRYPDIVVTQDPRDRPEHKLLQFPVVIVEVLSPSTERVDRGAKLDEYRSIETLREYVLVDSRKRWAQIIRRSDSEWVVGLPIESGVLEFASLNVAIAFDDLYDGTGL